MDGYMDGWMEELMNGSIAFADGFQMMLIAQDSLENLNQRMSEPVSMSRFRPKQVEEQIVLINIRLKP